MSIHALFQPICNFTDRLRAKHRGNQRKSGTPGEEKIVSKVTTGSAFPFPKLGSSETFTGDPLVYGPLDKWGLRSFLGNPHKSVLAEHNL